MGDSRGSESGSTHDWSKVVDTEHLAEVRRRRAEFAAGGVIHLVLEVLAYAADEAEVAAAGACVVALLADGSVSVSDNGRGTQSRTGPDGRPVRKPVAASKDWSRSEATAPRARRCISYPTRRCPRWVR